MSPRSNEFLTLARERLAVARDALGTFHDVSISLAYYACLYAARAALSEEDRHAKTHNGTWALFAELFVKPGRIDPALAKAAHRMEEDRAAVDYDATRVSPERAQEVVEIAERFVNAVEELYA